MTPKLTDDQRQAIEERGGTPVYVVDPTTDASYVLLRAEKYERLKAITGENEAEAMYPLLADLEPDNWGDASAYGVAWP
jgi:hypothetical protein